MKSVLMSIHPKWVNKITKGEKTSEVRKTAPKETPFKAYIYETKGSKGKGQVIGEFICDKVEKFLVPYDEWDKAYFEDKLKLTYYEITAYIGRGNIGYGWHISDLKIYDKPKELYDFIAPCGGKICSECNALEVWRGKCLNRGKRYITRPPQSWQYVQEIKNG